MSEETLAISAENVKITYNNGTYCAIQNLSLWIEQGSWTAIVGSNGSGKSTLAKALGGYTEYTSGRIKLGKGIQPHLVMQNPETQILGESILEEMKLGLSKRIHELKESKIRTDVIRESSESRVNVDEVEIIRATLDQVGLNLPLETPTEQLSGGELQLLNIAFCLITESNLFILDEVTSMLDLASRERVVRAAKLLKEQGATIVWLTHRADEIVYADRVIALEDGWVVFDGTPQVFFYGAGDKSNLEDKRADGNLNVLENNESGELCPCERLGMELPYVVQVAKLIEKRGHSLPFQPLWPEQLGEAVRAL